MKAIVKKSSLNGQINVPGSKSHTIRALAIAALAEGSSTIINPLISEDTISALNTVAALGIEIEQKNNRWLVHGNGGNFSQPAQPIDVGNSGTTLRLFSALCAAKEIQVTFDGDASLRSRPMKSLLSAIEQLGAKISSNNGFCPLTIQGPMTGGKVNVDGTTSQYTSALLIAAPTLTQETVIEVDNLNEVPYVDITLNWLKEQSISFSSKGHYTSFNVAPDQKYHAFDNNIAADFSTATFPLAAAALTGGKVTIDNLNFADPQGDKAVFDLFESMGTVIEKTAETTLIQGGKTLQAMNIDLNATPDALPAVAVAAALAQGTTVISNVAQARIKETDRISCMAKELTKMGANITETEDGMIVEGGTLKGAEVESYHDHRIAMALTIAGMAAEGTTCINDAECASVTYPSFFAEFQRLGAKITLN